MPILVSAVWCGMDSSLSRSPLPTSESTSRTSCCVSVDVDRSSSDESGTQERWQHFLERGVRSDALWALREVVSKPFRADRLARASETFVEDAVLQRAGDFCLWRDFSLGHRLSVKAVNGACEHFRIAKNAVGFRLGGIVGLAADSLHDLVLKLATSPMNVLAVMADSDLCMQTFVDVAAATSAQFVERDAVSQLATVAFTRPGKISTGLLAGIRVTCLESRRYSEEIFDRVLHELAVSNHLRRQLPNAPDLFYLPTAVHVETTPLLRFYPHAAHGTFASWSQGWECLPHHRLDCALQIASALSELHRLELIHGNVRAKNVLVHRHSTTGAFQFQLGGMEFAVLPDQSRQFKPFVFPHLRILAPEVFESAMLSPQSDVYAFGVFVWESFANRKHCNGETGRNLVLNALVGERKRFAREDDVFPAGMIELVNQCCNADVSKRPTMNGVWMTLANIHRRGQK